MKSLLTSSPRSLVYVVPTCAASSGGPSLSPFQGFTAADFPELLSPARPALKHTSASLWPPHHTRMGQEHHPRMPPFMWIFRGPSWRAAKSALTRPRVLPTTKGLPETSGQRAAGLAPKLWFSFSFDYKMKFPTDISESISFDQKKQKCSKFSVTPFQGQPQTTILLESSSVFWWWR